MQSQVTFQKQNIPYAADPGVARPHVEKVGNDLLLTFTVQDSGVSGAILFMEPLMFRVGDPNDEGFYRSGFEPGIINESIYSKKRFPDLKFWDFYEVFGVDWKSDLLGTSTDVLTQNFKEKEGFHHFVFFMKDGTFECVAREWEITKVA